MLRSFGEGNQKIHFRLRAGDDAASELGGKVAVENAGC
jgi:hypothetical protein